VATRRPSGPDIPLWVEEGLAEWVSRTPNDGGDLYFSDRLATVTPHLPKDHDFRSGRDDQLFVHYQSSRSAVRYFIEHYGYKRFVSFYKALGDLHEQRGSTAKHIDQTMHGSVGLDLRQFEAQWADTIGG
jgi:hypothetical protein